MEQASEGPAPAIVARVDENDAHVRLDAFLQRQPFTLSRRAAQRVIDLGLVRVNGRRAKKSHILSPGDDVATHAAALTPPAILPEPNLAVCIVYEDSQLVVLEKPAGMACQPVDPTDSGTVANFIVARFPETAAIGPAWREAGLVHRLDNDTSGLLVAARSPEAYAGLREQFSAGRVVKEYTALVQGIVEREHTLATPIAHDRRRRHRMRTCSADAKGAQKAITEIRPIERIGRNTLVAVKIETGVRHQIRVHLAASGHPLIGDKIYGPPQTRSYRRHLLHACYLAFAPPQGRRQQIEFRSGLPDDFMKIVQRLRWPGRNRTSGRHKEA